MKGQPLMNRPNSQMHPSVRKAIAFLDDGLRRGVWKDGDRLPPMRRLAADAHVSLTAMCAAVAAGTAGKHLTVIRKRGIFAGAPRTQYSTAGPGQSHWQRVKKKLETDIVRQYFSRSTLLPPQQELARRYRVSAATLRKALIALEHEGILVQAARRFALARPAKPHSLAVVPFISRDNDTGTVAVINDRFREFSYTLETERERTGIRFKAQPFFSASPDYSFLAQASSQAHIGYIVWANGIAPAKLPELVERLTRRKVPIAIIDEFGDLKLPAHIRHNPHVRIFCIAGVKAGHAIGKLLRQLGHRHIAYFSPYGNFTWSAHRFQGLRDIFIHEVSGAGRSGARAAYPTSITAYQTTTDIDSVELDKKKQAIMDTYVDVHWSVWRTFDSVELFAIGDDPGYFQARERLFLAMQELFDRAFQNGGVSAWVCVNDLTAVMAKNYLRKRRVRIPRDSAVVAFDESEFTYQHDVTSYNFAFPAIARTVVSYIIDPGRDFFMSGRIIECEGIIIERSTTGVPAI
jgi:DNA-binding LacI/PurR family transcriptional regulator